MQVFKYVELQTMMTIVDSSHFMQLYTCKYDIQVEPTARNPPWSRGEGKCLVNFRGMLPDSGSILRGVHFWEVLFALMLSPGWLVHVTLRGETVLILFSFFV